MRHDPYFLLVVSILLWPVTALGLANSARAAERVPQMIVDEPPTTELVVWPAAEPRASLKYRLLPEMLDLKPGNAAVTYCKVAMEILAYCPEEPMKRIEEDWLAVPLKDLPCESVRKDLEPFRSELDALHRAARCRHCDWQLPHEAVDPIRLPLPEIQQTRRFARMLLVQAKLQVARRQFDEAIRTLQTAYALGRHVAEGPTEVNVWVARGICGMTCDRIEEWIGQPGAPNMYWALTALPRPLVDARAALEMEMNVLRLALPKTRLLDDGQRSVEYWREFVEELWAWVDKWHGSGRAPQWQRRLLLAGLTLRGYPIAKRSLIDQGRSPEEVEAMPVPQVMITHMVETHEELFDQLFRWSFLPYWQAHHRLKEARQRLRDESGKREVVPIGLILAPEVRTTSLVQAKAERRIAMLRTIEALRIYGAAHDGRLPQKLSEVTEVPLPTDPVTGKQFIYRLEGNLAVLQAPLLPDMSEASYGRRYKIRFADARQ